MGVVGSMGALDTQLKKKVRNEWWKFDQQNEAQEVGRLYERKTRYCKFAFRGTSDNE